MTHYVDLSNYDYKKGELEHPSKNIGWLDAEKPFATGVVPREITHRLDVLSCMRFNQTRGFKNCPLCGAAMIKNTFGVILGSAEIKVPAAPSLYSSPNMIVHFITSHFYFPPDIYLDAVSRMPDPRSEEAASEFVRLGVTVPRISPEIFFDW